jgi:ABC-2 type transport system permease protein
MLLQDTALIYGRYLRQSLRSRAALLFGLLMPLLYLLFFGPLLTGLPLGGRGSSWQLLVPGLLLQLGLFGASFAGFAIIIEKGQGVVERMRVTPVSCSGGCCGTPRSSSSRRCCWFWRRSRWACARPSAGC